MAVRSITGKSVAVVGGAGFLGSHLVDHLIKDRDCLVLVIDNLSSGKREFVHPDADFLHMDITGEESDLRNAFTNYDVEYVFNYAACPYVPLSFQRPLHVCNVNAFGAMKVINAAHEANVRAILQVSSAELYGYNPSAFAISEHNLVQPHSSYGASKAMIDFYVQARWKEAQVPCIALRQFNCMGERETHPYVITEIISQLYRNKSPSVRLGNDTRRDFMYAGDAVRDAALLIERGEFGEVYNLGSQEEIGVYDLARLTGQLLGFGQTLVERDESRVRPWDIWHLRSDNRKIDERIGDGREVTPLSTAIQYAARWFHDNGRKWPWEK